MSTNSIILPSKPKIISETPVHGVYEIDGLYPGYGHTLGNSLRRIILSSINGVAITSVAIDGVKHEFSTLDGVKEDVISMIINLKKTRFKLHGDEPVTVNLKVKGPKIVTASMIDCPTQAEVVTKDQYLFEITTNTEVSMNINLEKGLGYVSREEISKDRADVGSIVLDAAFTPIRRVSYEVENMRVGDKTDHNRLRIAIETDGSVTPHEAFEKSIETMIHQLQSIIGFREFSTETVSNLAGSAAELEGGEDVGEDAVNKIKIEDLGVSTRTVNTLLAASIKTVGGLIRKSEDDLNEVEGMGNKGLEEIAEALAKLGLALKK
jgi:DNA-directed RNA polymerase subunit alpha